MKTFFRLVVLLPLFWGTLVHADLTIEIDHSSDNALPIGIVPFEWTNASRMPEQDIAKIVAANLYRSGKFKAVPEQNLPGLPSTPEEVNYPDWRRLGVDNVLIGRMSIDEKGLYSIEMRFMDVLRRQQVIGKRWTGITSKQLRQVAHKISDLIYKELTGIDGAFNTKIAYVTVTRDKGVKRYQLEVADADGLILSRFLSRLNL